MHLRQRSLANGLALLTCCTALAVGCSDEGDGTGGPDDEGAAGENAAGMNAGAGKSGASKGGSGGTSSAPEGGMAAGGTPEPGMAGAGGMSEGGMGGASMGEPVEYMIPAGGGEVQVMTTSGNMVAFAFPASAAGLMVTLQPDTSASVGWDDGRFVDVIRMEPDGTTFADPVEIRTANSDLLIFDYPSSASKQPAEGLPLNAAGNALVLEHFSTLVVVPPEYSCDSQSGWIATPNSDECAEFGADSTHIEFTCKAFSYCLVIGAECCAPAGSTACELGMSALTLSYTRHDSNGGQYPYCDPPNQGGGGTGGGGGASSGGTSSGGTSSGGSGSGGAAGTGSTAGTGGTASGGTGGGSAGSGGNSTGGSGGSGGGSGGPVPDTVLGSTYEVNAIRVSGGYVYYQNGSISRVPAGGGTATPIASGADFSGVFDLDATNVYFTSGGSLYAHDITGAGNDIDLAVTGAVFSNSFIEEAGGTLYIGNGINIYTAPVAGNAAAATLVASEPYPQSLVVSGADLYFVTGSGTGTHKNAVMKVATAGGAATPLIENLADGPRAVAVSGGYAYYVNGTAIARIPTAGGTPEPVAVSGGSYLAADGGDVYFVDNASLSRVATSGGNVSPLALSLSNPRLAVDATHVYFSTMSGAAPAPGIFRLAR